MNTPMVRPAQPADLPALARMWYEKAVLQQQADSRLRFAPDAETRWQLAAAQWLVDNATALLVADASDELAGFIVVRVQPGTPGLYAQIGVLVEMALDTHHYRGGVGRGLVGAACEWLQRRGVNQLAVNVARHSAVEQAFWRSLGAQEWMDGLWMTF